VLQPPTVQDGLVVVLELDILALDVGRCAAPRPPGLKEIVHGAAVAGESILHVLVPLSQEPVEHDPEGHQIGHDLDDAALHVEWDDGVRADTLTTTKK